MNKDVSVTGVQINVSTDSTYLLINKTSGSVQSGRLTSETSYLTSGAATATTASLKPTAHNPKTGDVIVSGSANVTNTATANAVGNWYTKIGAQPNASTAKANSEAALTSFDGYVLHETYYVELATGSVDASNLHVSASTISTAANDKSNHAVKVLVTSATGCSEQMYVDTNNTATWTTDTSSQLAATVTATTEIPIDVYVYYDGNDDSIYTENITGLDGATISLTFSVD